MRDGTTERGLVERAREGDHDAFALLVDRRLGSTIRSATAILGNESDARDATQRIFVQAWRELPSLRDVDAFRSWFGRIVVNTCRSALRERRRRMVREIPVAELGEAAESLTGPQSGHEERAAQLDRLERAFERIGGSERLILWLHHYEELPLADIAERLGVPGKTVKSRLFTARRSLERALAAEDDR